MDDSLAELFAATTLSPQQLPASEQLEDDAELESRTGRLDALPDEIQQGIFGHLWNQLDPRSAVRFASASKGLRKPMQRVGEGASKSPLQQLKEENAAAAALGLELGGAELQGAARGEGDL